MSGAITAAVITVGGGLVMANQAKQAAKGAANAQSQAAQAGITAQQSQFDAIQKLMAPFVQAGTGAVGAQQALLGLSGPAAQKAAIDAIQQGSQFQAMTQQGENAMLQNASATGGLRGGNLQGALAQFRPQLLNSLVNQQIGQLGQLAQLGQAGAAGQAAAGLQTGQGIANSYGQMGAAQAGGILGQSQANMAGLGLGFQGLGSFFGGLSQGGGGGFYNQNPWGGKLFGSGNGGTQKVI